MTTTTTTRRGVVMEITPGCYNASSGCSGFAEVRQYVGDVTMGLCRSCAYSGEHCPNCGADPGRCPGLCGEPACTCSPGDPDTCPAQRRGRVVPS